jgi:hypothetical protein
VLQEHSVTGSQCYRITVLQEQCYRNAVLQEQSVAGQACINTVLQEHSVTGTQCYGNKVLQEHSPQSRILGTEHDRRKVQRTQLLLSTGDYRN